MARIDGSVQVSTEGSGKLIDNTRYTAASSSDDIFRQRVSIGSDGTSSGPFLDLSTVAPASGIAAIPVRLVPTSTGYVAAIVGLSSQWGGSTVLDGTNEAFRVNVVAGGVGGGIVQVRSTGSVLTDVGWSTANLHMPVALTTDAFSTSIIDPRARTWTLSTGDVLAVVGATSGSLGAVHVSTGPAGAAIDPRARTWTLSTGESVAVVAASTLDVRTIGAGSSGVTGTSLISTGLAAAAIDPRQATIVGATSGAGLGTILSTGAGGAAIDPRARTWTLSTGDVSAIVGAGTSGLVGSVLLSTAAGAAAIDPRQVTLQAGSTATVIGQVALSTATGPLRVYGDVSTGSTAGANPLGFGGMARTTNPAAASDGARAFAMTDKLGRLITVAGHVRDLVVSTGVTVTSTAETSILGAAGAGVFHDLTSLTITNRSTSAVVRVVISSSSGSGSSGYNFTLAERGGVTIPFNPPLPQNTANSAWVATVVTGASTVDITVVAVKNL